MKKSRPDFQVTARGTPALTRRAGGRNRGVKHLALCSRGERAAAFLVLVGAGPLRRVHVRALGRGGRSSVVVLVHVGALVTQPLVAERAQALSERRLGTLGAALSGGRKTQRTLVWTAAKGRGRRGHKYSCEHFAH